ncbi:MAG: hypothetical protein WKF82_09515 [Nocardioidaceae bacterium]
MDLHAAVPRRELDVWPCQSRCDWKPTSQIWANPGHDELRVFACTGCGSEWVRTETWTPVDSSGVVPPEVEAELAAHR